MIWEKILEGRRDAVSARKLRRRRPEKRIAMFCDARRWRERDFVGDHVPFDMAENVAGGREAADMMDGIVGVEKCTAHIGGFAVARQMRKFVEAREQSLLRPLAQREAAGFFVDEAQHGHLLDAPRFFCGFLRKIGGAIFLAGKAERGKRAGVAVRGTIWHADRRAELHERLIQRR